MLLQVYYLAFNWMMQFNPFRVTQINAINEIKAPMRTSLPYLNTPFPHPIMPERLNYHHNTSASGCLKAAGADEGEERN